MPEGGATRRPSGTPPGPELGILAAFALAIAVGSAWGLPGSHSWAADSISPRSCGLGAIAETYRPGHFHTYPPLQMALLTLVSLPWMALAVARVGTGVEALAEELIQPRYMTGIEVGARLIAACMALAFARDTMRLWTRLAGRRAGIGAGIVVAANATLVYYAHTGNLEVPYLFWVGRALLEMDRVMCGQRREAHALLFSAAAVLTKDQAGAALLLPLPMALVLVPWAFRRESLLRRRLLAGGLAAVALYALASGAVVNPSGFHGRLEFLFGPASQTWALYPRGLRGAAALVRDALRTAPHFTSWPVAVAATLGAVIAVVTAIRGASRAPGRPGSPDPEGALERLRALLPAVAGLSFTLFFTLGARRSEDRFLLPQSVLLLPYAAVLFDRVAGRAARLGAAGRRALALAAGASLAPAVLGVASMDATLLGDARYTAERFLAALPRDTRIEVYGGPIFLPRVPTGLAAVRPGIEPVGDRQRIAGVAELVDPALDPRPRHPDFILLATELSSTEATEPLQGPHPYGLMSYRDPISHALLRGLLDGSLGYSRTLRATCEVPWPLECRRIHGSTGREVWIYAPTSRLR